MSVGVVFDFTALVNDIQYAPIGKEWDGELSRLLKSAFAVGKGGHFTTGPSQEGERFLGPFAVSNIAGEAASLKELAAMPLDAGSHQNVFDGTILTTEASLVVVHDLAPSQSGQDVLDRLAVDVKFAFVVADVLIAIVTEHIELGLVGAEDDAVRPGGVERNCGTLEEVGQLTFAAAQFHFRFTTLRDIAKDENHPAYGAR